jgi:hypothetical protein
MVRTSLIALSLLAATAAHAEPPLTPAQEREMARLKAEVNRISNTLRQLHCDESRLNYYRYARRAAMTFDHYDRKENMLKAQVALNGARELNCAWSD